MYYYGSNALYDEHIFVSTPSSIGTEHADSLNLMSRDQLLPHFSMPSYGPKEQVLSHSPFTITYHYP